jgi:hypothetical protein
VSREKYKPNINLIHKSSFTLCCYCTSLNLNISYNPLHSILIAVMFFIFVLVIFAPVVFLPPLISSETSIGARRGKRECYPNVTLFQYLGLYYAHLQSPSCQPPFNRIAICEPSCLVHCMKAPFIATPGFFEYHR